MAAMKKIDWNKMSELGLIEQINTEILHPVGLAIFRNPETGFSEGVLIADDGFFEYSQNRKTTILNKNELVKQIKAI
ncbi:DUF7415 domain-containing protein [Psychromonas ossibalaenae]|uniref:DUF7415 domain-containing protein n=1 Tax=Psychromonas ossibalaenae TaxID=444922 RepID=UPI000372F4A8|nr:hypothetical protein [Psychromonas ossibalaenae]